MRLTRITAPLGLPVEISDARKYCRVDHQDEDGLLEGLIGAAVDLLDGPTGVLGRAIVSQAWRLEVTQWPTSLLLPIEPVTSVSVAYIDAGGDVQTLADDQTLLVSNPGAVPVLSWISGFVAPALNADAPYPVRIDMQCGFGTAAAVPAAISTAIKMMVGHWYDNRGIAGEARDVLPMAVSALLARYRRLL